MEQQKFNFQIKQQQQQTLVANNNSNNNNNNNKVKNQFSLLTLTSIVKLILKV